MDSRLEKFLDGVMGVVEATSFEQHCLWRDYKKDWVQNSSGLGKTVGYIDDRPVFLCLSTNVVKGMKILFFESTSTVVDHDIIRKWIEENLPESAYHRGRLNTTDANNFHNIFSRLNDPVSEFETRDQLGFEFVPA